MPIHHHSKLAREALAAEGHLSRRQAIILAYMQANLRPHTDRQIASALGFGQDLNTVRPRITELVGMGLLDEVDAVTCPVTKKTVRRVAWIDPQAELPLFR